MIKAIKTNCIFGHYHPSRSEANYCLWLLARKQNGEIKQFGYIYSLQLHIDEKYWKTWKADFWVINNAGTLEVHESKGWNRSDDNFRLKLNIARRNYPDLPIFVNKIPVIFTPKGRIILKTKRRKIKWLKEK